MGRRIGSKDKKKRKSILRSLAPLAVPLGTLSLLGGLAYQGNKMDQANAKTKFEQSKELIDLQNKNRKELLDDLLGERAETKPKTPEELINEDRVKGSQVKQGLSLDNPALENKLKNRTTKGANRLRNLDKIMRGSESNKFGGLATDLHVLKNYKKYKLDKAAKSKLIKQVASKLSYLKAAGRFSYTNELSTFARSIGARDKGIRRKKPVMLGEKLSTKLRKGIISGGGLGLAAGATQDLLVHRKLNVANLAKSTAVGSGIGAGFGTLTWGLSPRSPIGGIRKWQQNRNR